MVSIPNRPRRALVFAFHLARDGGFLIEMDGKFSLWMQLEFHLIWFEADSRKHMALFVRPAVL